MILVRLENCDIRDIIKIIIVPRRELALLRKTASAAGVLAWLQGIPFLVNNNLNPSDVTVCHHFPAP